MAGKITNFFRETQLVFSLILTIVGFIVLFIGATGSWFENIKKLFNMSEDFWQWSPYLLIIGFIIFVTGVYYLYSYIKNRKFVLDELKTNKRSELIKKHSELKSTVKHLPMKYQKMLADKDEEFNIK